MQSVEEIKITGLVPSPTNPRKSFDPAAISELAESIKEHGVVEPLLVRKIRGKRGKLEIVAGERRWRASKQARIETVPCMVRSLDDKTTLEIQLIENLQRQDLNPLEEAEGYQALLETHGYKAEDLAAKLGKSKSYLYGRLKLLALPDNARVGLSEGVISASTALLIARIPDPDLRSKAGGEVLEPTWEREPMTFRKAKEWIHNRYMVRLKGAPFPLKDEGLVPEAGSCLGCPKRTGNQREIFEDVQSADVCTDPACFRAKADAHWERVKAKHLEAGNLVKEGQNAGSLRYSPSYRVLSRACLMAPTKGNGTAPTYRKLLGKDCPRKTVVRTEGGEVIELARAADVDKALKAKYPWAAKKLKALEVGSSSDYASKQRRLNAIYAAVSDEVLGRLAAAVEREAEFAAPLIYAQLCRWAIEQQWSDAVKDVVKRRGLMEPKSNSGDWEKALAGLVDGMTPAQRLGLLAEVLASRYHGCTYNDDGGDQVSEHLAEACNLFGIDLAAMVKEEKARAAKKTRKKGKR